MKLLSLKIPGPDGKPIDIQGAPGQHSGGLPDLVNILKVGIELLILFAIVLTLFSLIYAGFQWMVSHGDKQKIQNARQRISFILVGIVVVLAAFFVIGILSKFFGVNLLNIPSN